MLILGCWTLISLHQILIPVNSVSDFLEDILKFFIADRYSIYKAAGGDGGRGASGFTGEPSGAAIVIILFLAMLKYYYQSGELNRTKKYFAISCSLILVYSNGSGTLWLLIGIYILFGIISLKNNLLLTLIFASLILVISSDFMPETRLQQIIWDFKSNMNLIFDVNVAYALTLFMGHRVYNWIYSYGSLFDNYGLGHLVMGWDSEKNMEQIIATIGWFPSDFANFTHITYEGIIIKPWSFFSIWLYDFGWPATIFFLIFIIIVLKKTPRQNIPEYAVAVTLFFLFPPITAATQWIIFSICKKRKF